MFWIFQVIFSWTSLSSFVDKMSPRTCLSTIEVIFLEPEKNSKNHKKGLTMA